MAEPLRIQITSEAKGNQTPGVINTQNSVFKAVYANQVVQSVINSAKQSLSYSINHIGDFTGDYIRQANVENSINALNEITGIGTSLAIGFAVNPVIGLTTLASTVISKGVNIVLENKSFNANLAKTNYGATFNSSVIGSILTDGNK